MVRKGNLAVFEGSSISETGEALPTKIVVRACDINLYLHEFFEPIVLNPDWQILTREQLYVLLRLGEQAIYII